VPDLTGEAVGAAVEASVEHETAADPGAEGHDDHVVAALGRAHLPLPPCRARGIVVDLHGHLQPLLEQHFDAEVADARQIGRHVKHTVAVHQSRRAHTHGVHPTVSAQTVDDRDEGVDESGRPLGCGHPALAGHLPLIVEGNGQHLGATHIDADRP